MSSNNSFDLPGRTSSAWASQGRNCVEQYKHHSKACHPFGSDIADHYAKIEEAAKSLWDSVATEVASASPLWTESLFDKGKVGGLYRWPSSPSAATLLTFGPATVTQELGISIADHRARALEAREKDELGWSLAPPTRIRFQLPMEGGVGAVLTADFLMTHNPGLGWLASDYRADIETVEGVEGRAGEMGPPPIRVPQKKRVTL